VDEYLRMVRACAMRDREGVISASLKLGFLTGDETKEMVDLHVQAGFIIGEPFGTAPLALKPHVVGSASSSSTSSALFESAFAPYDFVQGNIAGRVAPLAHKMMHSRLAAPPKEVRSVFFSILHRIFFFFRPYFGAVRGIRCLCFRVFLLAVCAQAYTLHRKLSGAFITCRKLGAVAECRTVFEKIWNEYKFG
jgi:aarF domain-containing kinase